MIDLIRRGQSSVYGQVSDVVVKGLTATNIVQNGNFEGTTKWGLTAATLSAENNVLRVTGNGAETNPRTYQVISKLANKTNKMFAKTYVRVTNSACTSIKIYWNAVPSGEKVISNPVENQWYLINVNITSPIFGANPAIFISHHYADAETANGKIMEVKEVMVIDMTAEGLDVLTEEQMNAKFPHWFDGTKSTNSVRVRSVGKNLFDGELELGAYSTSTGLKTDNEARVRSKNKVKVKPNTQYTLKNTSFNDVVYVNTYDKDGNFIEYIGYGNTITFTTGNNTFYIAFYSLIANGTNLLSKFQLELGATPTTYEPYKESIVNVNLPEPLRSLPNGVKDEFNVITGVKTQKIGNPYILDGSSNWSAGTALENVYIFTLSTGNLNQVNGIVVNCSIIGYGSYGAVEDKEGVYFNASGLLTYKINKSRIDGLTGATIREKFTNWLSANRPALTYQLAEPIIEYIDPQPLQVFPNGTRWVEHANKEVAVYNTGIHVANTDLPIKEMIKVDKIGLQNGRWYRESVNLADVTVAGDGLSFTIDGAESGAFEQYEFEYYYDSALSTLPELVIPSEPSLMVIKNRNISL